MPDPAGKEKPKPSLREMLPEVWALMRPRRPLLVMGFALMVVNRLAGLVLPASTKYLIDDVIGKRHASLLTPLVLAVLAATLVQGSSSYALTQILSKAAQRLIADMRRQVQRHVGRLSVAYYDANKTGVLVSRIMSDVEGVRNLIGTGLVEFAGAVLTSIFALVILLRISATMTLIAIGFLLVLGVTLQQAMSKIRPMFRARPKIQGEVTGRLTESLGGVRVVKGYRAEESEAGVFAGGVQRLLDNVLKTLTAMSVMNLSSSVLLGIVSAVIMFIGARQILVGTMTLGTLVTYTVFLGMLVAPVFQIVAI
ncbi:MAG TPA: ABC transporter ATP-binding protein, partial [Candidatus Acidoferrales bacterium]|nr:ABC transporter ATP-binding protein [Candidatus Acidoferrales bacterium]